MRNNNDWLVMLLVCLFLRVFSTTPNFFCKFIPPFASEFTRDLNDLTKVVEMDEYMSLFSQLDNVAWSNQSPLSLGNNIESAIMAHAVMAP